MVTVVIIIIVLFVLGAGVYAGSSFAITAMLVIIFCVGIEIAKAFKKKRKEASYSERTNNFSPTEKIRLIKEIDKYLNKVTMPTMLILPESRENVIKYMYSDYRGGIYSSHSVNTIKFKYTTQDYKIRDFYRDNFTTFLNVLKEKGFDIAYRENSFLDLFIEELIDLNYLLMQNKYGDFISEEQTVDEAILFYIDTVGVDQALNTDRLSFLCESLKINEIAIFDIPKLSPLVSSGILTYKENYAKNKMLKKMESKYLTEKMTIATVDILTGVEFENCLKNIFEQLGYFVKTTKVTGDQGVDLLIKKNNEVTAVQAKCYSSSVGNAAVQQVIAGMAFYGAQKSMVVTNSYFTSSAKSLAGSTGTILWDRDKLNEILKLIY